MYQLISINRTNKIKQYLTKPVVSWALYDWANSAFAVVVLTAFYPVLFGSFWSTGVDPTVTTARIGAANSVSSIVIVLLAPILGAIADASQAKKRFLIAFALVGIVMTGCLFFIGEGQWLYASICFVFAAIGFMGANVFYDSLIVNVTQKDKYDGVSALGYSLGYLGGGLLFLITVIMSQSPESFGFTSQSEAIQFSFVAVSLWWFIFSLPIMLFVHETGSGVADGDKKINIIAGIKQLKQTINEIRALKVVFMFLIAYWLYIDGVDTIVRMAIPYGMSIGLDSSNLIIAILITQFVGFPSALVFGFLGQKWGAKRAILLAIGVYLVITVLGSLMDSVEEFYILAISIGLVQGGVQSLSRSFYARIIPHSKSAEFFGFYNMLGKFAAVLGPIMMGAVGVITGDPRLSILSIAVLFVAGGVLLYFVDEQKGIQMAKELED